ncbi:winged helix-turn-helix transcriptional regulator [Shewanella algae]|uniref:winged helix-turn-helix domain-containing protein n=1 Tax=Shewanella algae TaxID=38313 RepID=UPI001AACADC6|nr:winged helix-turn-helix domain-containing protein [Shewanella algae]MBO2596329.1 winged helix-turn-helix transcriptional regulator [Shewanella algae]MBO2667687.1 winged helix-turn-helix transcriptional regulator [Shewanella algae]
MLTERNRDDFYKAADSLKRFKRAEIKDEQERSLIETLYTDLLPENQVFKMILSDNTTFLVGRKGTGKSTIILRLESEYRKQDDYLPCYIDTKTVFESTKSEYQNLDYLKGRIPEGALGKYLVERSFIQSILKAIIKELDTRADTYLSKLAKVVGLSKTNNVKERISKLLAKIDNNDHLKSIELPVINEYVSSISAAEENETSTSRGDNESVNFGIDSKGLSTNVKGGSSSKNSDRAKQVEAWEKKFSGALLKVFQIKDVMEEVREILKILKIKKLVIFLDDFSEVDEITIKNFVDVVLAPLNNWGDEFICFKVAAYPNRLYFGDIDKGKVDVIDLDFYNLYSNYDKNTMESLSLDFTKRLVNTRIKYFSTQPVENYFDVSSSMTIDDYMELLFKCSMNVPRIIGYLLFYCHQTHISLGRKITKTAIESAAQKYYEKVISSFFDIATNSLLSFDEKVSELQQRNLLNVFVNQLKSIRRQIITGELSSAVYQADKTNPHTSHFNFSPNLERFVRTLELNFFISKYSEMSDRDGKKVSVYCLNYGLTLLENMRWGKPPGNEFRKYFIARPFGFDGIFEVFLKESKHIQCVNPECGKIYPYEQLPFLEFNKMRCNECQSEVKVKSVSDDIKRELDKIDRSKLLPSIELGLMHELNSSNEKMYARDLSEELDISSYLIAKRAKKLDEEKGLIDRDRTEQLIKYSISKKAIEEYFNNN